MSDIVERLEDLFQVCLTNVSLKARGERSCHQLSDPLHGSTQLGATSGAATMTDV